MPWTDSGLERGSGVSDRKEPGEDEETTSGSGLQGRDCAPSRGSTDPAVWNPGGAPVSPCTCQASRSTGAARWLLWATRHAGPPLIPLPVPAHASRIFLTGFRTWSVECECELSITRRKLVCTARFPGCVMTCCQKPECVLDPESSARVT